MTIRVVLVDDHLMVRTALAAVLSQAEGIDVVADVLRDSAVRVVNNLKPDVLLLDISSVQGDGIRLCAKLASAAPGSACLVFACSASTQLADRALRAGARGILSKYSSMGTLLQAVHAVAVGQKFLDSKVAVDMLVGAALLQDRERAVVELVSRGLSGSEIARQLLLSVGTVRNYTSSAMRRCGARNRVDLVRIAVESGLVDPVGLSSECLPRATDAGSGSRIPSDHGGGVIR